MEHNDRFNLDEPFDELDFHNVKDLDAAIKVITAFTKATTIQNRILAENVDNTKKLTDYFISKEGFIKDLNYALKDNKAEIIKEITKNNRIFFLSIAGILTTISVIITIIFSSGLA